MANILPDRYPMNDPANGVEVRRLYDYSSGEPLFVDYEVAYHCLPRDTKLEIAKVVLTVPDGYEENK